MKACVGGPRPAPVTKGSSVGGRAVWLVEGLPEPSFDVEWVDVLSPEEWNARSSLQSARLNMSIIKFTCVVLALELLALIVLTLVN